jgi:UDP-N-acetylglucosamine--dolichyl-phosphate N-acetylglucosaminephosphotransferase
MVALSLFVSAVASFGAGCAIIPWLIQSLRGTTLVGKDLNKPTKPLVPEMGGIAVILAFYVGIALVALLASEVIDGAVFFAALSACMGAGIVGLMDDMFRLRQRTKALLPFLLALPLGIAVYTSGNHVLLNVDIGLFMVLVVPLGVTSAANAANMLEGFNGLGAGLGVIMTSALVLLSVLTGSQEGMFLLLPLLGALIAFLWFNRYPARIFPGDSMTLFMGATLACAAIISSPSLKTYGAILFAPMIVEFFLKLRGHFQSENYGRLDPEGHLLWEGKVESLAHAVMRWKPLNEWQVVGVIWGIEAVVSSLVIIAVAVGL